MKRSRLLITITLATAALAGPLHAACYADYRARMDNPFRLHYGVIALPDADCSVAAAQPVIASRIAAGGWSLLEVVSVFEDSALEGKRQDAGDYFLRF
jgi:hypothetical protein